ncbi:MAG: nucleotide-binding protein [Tardiphaga sp.]|uniref:hypothetical protein n=1 Tax=Tardiphaga sp. TaxID=1926292 RepID=UPI00261BB0BF|nr:hypothetical protein [Tardiphaga sp.]MDB5504756.1 nucleotide-binding protein [Tardiphaga sp.]
MAPRRPKSPIESPTLTVDQMRRRIDRFKNCIQELDAFDPQKVQKRYRIPEVMALEAAIDGALSAAFGHDTPTYHRFSRAASLDNGPHMSRGGDWGDPQNYDEIDAREARQYLAEGKVQSISMLRQAIRALEDDIADKVPDTSQTPQQPASTPGDKVFLVHGRDDAVRTKLRCSFARLDSIQSFCIYGPMAAGTCSQNSGRSQKARVSLWF